MLNVVFLATDANGAPSSTAKQVVAAINAEPEAAALLKATTYRDDAGAGIVAPAPVNLTDFLNAPASYRAAVPAAPVPHRHGP